jgi:hypothetical protein
MLDHATSLMKWSGMTPSGMIPEFRIAASLGKVKKQTARQR